MNPRASADSTVASLEQVALDSAATAQAQWSNWSRCESSFSLVLVPHRAGVFVLAEEIGPVGADARMLAVFHVAEADDLARSVSRVFASGSELREKVLTTPCFLRYAAIDDATQRQMIAMALNRWLAEARAAAPKVGSTSADVKNAGESPASTQANADGPALHDILIDSDPGDEQPAGVFDAAWAVPAEGGRAPSGSPATSSSALRASVGDRRRETRWRGPFPAGF